MTLRDNDYKPAERIVGINRFTVTMEKKGGAEYAPLELSADDVVKITQHIKAQLVQHIMELDLPIACIGQPEKDPTSRTYSARFGTRVCVLYGEHSHDVLPYGRKIKIAPKLGTLTGDSSNGNTDN